MIATNELLNRINEWNAPEHNAFKRHMCSRVTNLCATAPMETLAVAQNILTVPFQVVGVTLNLGTKVLSVICCSKALRDFRANLPSISDLCRTLARIVLYAVGTVFTATIGVLSPSANFKLHCAMGLAVDQREEAIKIAIIEAELERLEELTARIEAQVADAETKAVATTLETTDQTEVEVLKVEDRERSGTLKAEDQAQVEVFETVDQVPAEILKTDVQEDAKGDLALMAAGAVVVDIADELEKAADDVIEVSEPVFAQVQEPAFTAGRDKAVDIPVAVESDAQNEAARSSDEAEKEDDEDTLFIFEGTEDTAFTRAVQGAIETGVRVTKMGRDKAVDASKKLTNFFLRSSSEQENSHGNV